jgi:hypothetical protein
MELYTMREIAQLHGISCDTLRTRAKVRKINAAGEKIVIFETRVLEINQSKPKRQSVKAYDENQVRRLIKK